MSARVGRTSYEFLDTNVLVYAHDRSAGIKHEQAGELVDRLWTEQAGCVSVQVLQEFYVTVTRKVTPSFAPAAATQVIEELSHWRVHAPRAADVLQAIRVQQRYGIALWDALIIWSAASLGCEIMWSEDLASGQVYMGVRVENPFA